MCFSTTVCDVAGSQSVGTRFRFNLMACKTAGPHQTFWPKFTGRCLNGSTAMHALCLAGESVSLGIAFGTGACLADSVAMPQTVAGPVCLAFCTTLCWPALLCSALHCCALIPARFFSMAHLSPAVFQRAGLRGLEAGSVPVARGRLLSPPHCCPTE